MLSAFELSYRVQELRLAYWAQDREDLVLPPELSKETGLNKIQFLAKLILNHDLKQSGFFYVLEFDENYSRFRIELPAVAQLVDQACMHNIHFEPTYFPPPRKEHPYVYIYPFDGGVYALDQQVCELQHDLQIYQKLQQDAATLELPAKKLSKQEKWQQEFARSLRWNRHARNAKTQIHMQRTLIDELIRTNTPNEEEDHPPTATAPVRVEVEQGQTLEEALLLALYLP